MPAEMQNGDAGRRRWVSGTARLRAVEELFKISHPPLAKPLASLLLQTAPKIQILNSYFRNKYTVLPVPPSSQAKHPGISLLLPLNKPNPQPTLHFKKLSSFAPYRPSATQNLPRANPSSVSLLISITQRPLLRCINHHLFASNSRCSS